MNDTTQKTAAEAWEKICDLTSKGTGKTEDFIAIIQSAIDSYVTQPKEIPLTDGKFATVDHQDFISLVGLTWHCTSHGRAATGKTNYMHKVIAAQMGIVGEVDHIDGNPLNNRRSNLRGCTRTQNQANAPKSRGSTSQYKGVHWSESHNGWVAQIKHNEKVTYLGKFDDEMDAAITYDTAARKEFGEFAKINFPIVQKHIEKATEEITKQRDDEMEANRRYRAHITRLNTRLESRAAHASEPLKVSEIAICENCGTQQHDQIDHICTTCNRAELVNLVDILKQGRDWLKSRSALQPAHASEHECTYSRQMDQPYPRHCIVCGKVESQTGKT